MSDDARIDPRHLRPVLEFVLDVAREAHRRSPAAAVPAALKPFVREKRVPNARLAAVVRAAESEPMFLERLGRVATVDDVGEIGVVWLQRGDGWQARLVELAEAAEQEQAETDLSTALRSAEKRRDHAMQARARAEAELLGVRHQLDQARDELAALEQQRAAAQAETGELRRALDAARADARRHSQRAESLDHRLAEAPSANSPEQPPSLAGDDRQALGDITKAAAELADRLADLEHRIGEPTAVVPRRRIQRRTPLVRPGGVRAGTVQEAEFLLRAGAAVLIDGYNVAKLTWPQLGLPEQRERMLAHAENAARRFGSDITVVFDGARVPGAATDVRRIVRVMYSPEGVLADDVIRSEVDRLPAGRAVVVVTEDQEIVHDVRIKGADVIASRVFAATV